MTPEETQPTDPLLDSLEESLAEVDERRDETISDWLCKVLLDIEAKKASIKADRDTRVDAINGAAEAELSSLERRIKAVWWKYGQEVKAAAWLEIEGKKQKYVQTPYGRLQFRTKPARDKVVILDEAVALEAAKKHCPEAVKTTEKILVSLLEGFKLPGTTIDHQEAATVIEYKATKPRERDNAREE